MYDGAVPDMAEADMDAVERSGRPLVFVVSVYSGSCGTDDWGEGERLIVLRKRGGTEDRRRGGEGGGGGGNGQRGCRGFENGIDSQSVGPKQQNIVERLGIMSRFRGILPCTI